MDSGVLFVECIRMRPSAERVLAALAIIGGGPGFWQAHCTTFEIAERTGLTRHQVRARLCDLRRKGLVESWRRRRKKLADPRRNHYLTKLGDRRAKQIVNWINT